MRSLAILILLPDERGISMEEEVMTKTIKWKMLVATLDESEAYLLKHRLESEGIQCRVQTGNAYPGISHGGRARELQVYVPVTEFEASQQAIDFNDMEEDSP